MQIVAIKVAIAVEGGCVQRVLAADPDRLEVIVLDYDRRDDNANRTPVPGEDDGRCADVWPATVEPLPPALGVMFGPG
ncbi:MAG: hypothetical protein V9G18_22450 [Albidovulum sp.]